MQLDAEQGIPHRQLGPHMPLRGGGPVDRPVGAEPRGLHQGPGIAPIGLDPAAPGGVHRREVGVRHDHRVSERLQVPRHPLALGRGLQQYPRRRPVPQHCGEPLPAGDDPAFDDLPVLGENAELALALVQINPYDIHGGWPSRWRPRARVKVVGRNCHHVQWRASRFILTMRGR